MLHEEESLILDASQQCIGELRTQLAAMTERAEKAEAAFNEVTGLERPRDAIMKVGELVSERNQLQKRAEAAEAVVEKLMQAYQILKAMPTSHMGHWDSTMQRGVGCPICIAQRKAFAQAAELFQSAVSEPEQEKGKGDAALSDNAE
jgi:DNA repair exonuclease SbcCD ATPase subunit